MCLHICVYIYVSTCICIHLWLDGPSSTQPAQELEYVISNDPLTLTAEMEAYPALNYQWFSGEELICESDICEVPTKYYVS